MMADEKPAFCQTGKMEVIQCAVADADRMIYFATQEKINEPDDLKCLENLVKVTCKLKAAFDKQEDVEADIIAEFFKQLAIMSHILYPVTSISLRLLDQNQCQPCMIRAQDDRGAGFFRSLARKVIRGLCFSPSLTAVAILAGLCLFFTIYLLGFSLTGADIIGKLDGLIKDKSALRRDFVAAAQEYKPDSKQVPYKALNILRSMRSNSIRMGGLTDHLDNWNKSFIGDTILFGYKFLVRDAEEHKPGSEDQGKDSPASPSPQNAENESGKGYVCGKLIADGNYQECLQREIEKIPFQYKPQLEMKNRGLLIFSVLNNCILPMFFGFCGAFAYILRTAVNEIRSHAFEGIGGMHVMGIRILLGAISGFFLGYLMQSNDLVNLLSSSEGGSAGGAPIQISLASPLTLAFIGGYSVDILFNIMNRFIYALTNDERYLPASELQKRKVDVSKFLRKEGEG